MHNIVIFDIDGTLIQSLDIEGEAFLHAMRCVYNHQVPLSVTWEDYTYSTDSGIFFEMVQALYNRAPSHDEILSMQTHFLRYFHTWEQQTPAQCQPILGATDIFDTLRAHGWDVAIATGCWQRSALWKLQSAGLLRSCLKILATCDAHYDRADIIRLAITQAKLAYARTHYTKAVYVGDRPWDKRAADQVGVHFVGVGDYWPNSDHAVFHLPHYADKHSTSFLNYLHAL